MIDEKALIAELEAWKQQVAQNTDIYADVLEMGIDVFICKVKKQAKISEWIPVEERLPELFVDETFDVANSNPVLITITDCFGGTGTRTGEVAKNLKNGRVNWLGLNSVLKEKVLAWQPIPSPYNPPEQRSKLPQSWVERIMSQFERFE